MGRSSSTTIALLILFSVYDAYGTFRNPCENGIDLGIIADRSKSVGNNNFPKVKKALKDLVDNFNISQNATHVSVIFYADKPEQLFNLSDSRFHSSQAVQDRIDAVPIKLFNPTRTDLALMEAHDELFQSENGDRDTHMNVLIVLTDGRTNKESAPYDETIPPLEDKGVQIIAAGIGDKIKRAELDKIAGSRGSVVQIKDFDSFNDKLTEILAKACVINGGYTAWSLWSDCSATCDGGMRFRTRNCSNPEPAGGGRRCNETAPGHETAQCNTQLCDDSINGGYTPWTSWTPCTKRCGRNGVRMRFRSCSNPLPQGNGASCDVIGPAQEMEKCNQKKCKREREPCKEGLDLGIMIDRSLSIRKSNLESLLTTFLPAFTKNLKISGKKTRVGIMMYNRKVEVFSTFKTHNSAKELKKLLKSIPVQLGRQTRTDKGLIEAGKQLFSKKGGDRGKRQNVLVTFTDGRAWPKKRIIPFSETVPRLTRGKQCHMVAVGYGAKKLNTTQLAEIAGDNVVMVTRWPKDIKKLVSSIKKKVCAVHGGYSQWGMWSLCSATCGTGVKLRTRMCDSPRPRKGGKDCTELGDSYQTMECKEAACPTANISVCEDKKKDVCVIMDMSKSVGRQNVALLKSFVVQLIDQFSSQTHFSVITFARDATVRCTFSNNQCQTTSGAHALVAGLPDELQKGTRTDRALIAANQTVFTPDGGDREDADNVVIVLTDGKTNRGSAPFSETVPPLRDGKNATMIALGVGRGINEQELTEMVGEQNWLYVGKFEDMTMKLPGILNLACPTNN